MREVKSIKVLNGGLLTTVQDLGRFGFQCYGMPVSGPMDEISHRLANILVGNHPGAACLEATISGPELLFEDNTDLCICGANMQSTLNGIPLPNNKPIAAQAGDVLKMGFAISGARAYIGFSGGIQVPEVMKSRSTFLAGGIGGFHGRALKAGDRFITGPPTGKPIHQIIPATLTDHISSANPIRILPGPEISHFDTPAIVTLLNARFIISPNSNRMGYRLEGDPVFPRAGKGNIISSPVPMGTIQIPADGNPIILMADRQTTGGYPRMAVVASADLPRLGQLNPGDTITFSELTLSEAQTLRNTLNQTLNRLA